MKRGMISTLDSDINKELHSYHEHDYTKNNSDDRLQTAGEPVPDLDNHLMIFRLQHIRLLPSVFLTHL
jgi:hypothetical protein